MNTKQMLAETKIKDLEATIDGQKQRIEHLDKTCNIMARVIRNQSLKWARNVTMLNLDQADASIMSEQQIREMYEKEAS